MRWMSWRSGWIRPTSQSLRLSLILSQRQKRARQKRVCLIMQRRARTCWISSSKRRCSSFRLSAPVCGPYAATAMIVRPSNKCAVHTTRSRAVDAWCMPVRLLSLPGPTRTSSTGFFPVAWRSPLRLGRISSRPWPPCHSWLINCMAHRRRSTVLMNCSPKLSVWPKSVLKPCSRKRRRR